MEKGRSLSPDLILIPAVIFVSGPVLLISAEHIIHC